MQDIKRKRDLKTNIEKIIQNLPQQTQIFGFRQIIINYILPKPRFLLYLRQNKKKT